MRHAFQIETHALHLHRNVLTYVFDKARGAIDFVILCVVSMQVQKEQNLDNENSFAHQNSFVHSILLPMHIF